LDLAEGMKIVAQTFQEQGESEQGESEQGESEHGEDQAV
jgi:hypothetical protein